MPQLQPLVLPVALQDIEAALTHVKSGRIKEGVVDIEDAIARLKALVPVFDAACVEAKEQVDARKKKPRHERASSAYQSTRYFTFVLPSPLPVLHSPGFIRGRNLFHQAICVQEVDSETAAQWFRDAWKIGY